jgi:hypothetical protein
VTFLEIGQAVISEQSYKIRSILVYSVLGGIQTQKLLIKGNHAIPTELLNFASFTNIGHLSGIVSFLLSIYP